MGNVSSEHYLEIKEGPHLGATFPLLGTVVTLGRHEDNHIVIDDPRVSRHHAQLTWDRQTFALEDLDSGNGTWVNGQRIAGRRYLKPGDEIGLSPEVVLVYRRHSHSIDETQPVSLPEEQPAVAAPDAGGHKGFLLFGVGGLVGVAIVVVALVVGGGLICLLGSGSGQQEAAVTPVVVEEVVLPTDTPVSTAAPAETEEAGAASTSGSTAATAVPPFELARRATVFVAAFVDNADGEAHTGSGSVIDPRGYILTNYHVVSGTRLQYVGLNSPRQDAPPESFYSAEIVASDSDLDLAILRISGDVDGNPLDGTLILPILEIGDSDNVNLGDSIVVLGFPGLGQETVTLTKGTVSGFINDSELGLSHGWIKTDAEISPGNSGGVAINESGQLIGVPTRVFFNTESVGEIGLVRPINFARDLLSQIP